MSELFKYPRKFLEAHEDVAEIIAQGCDGRRIAGRKLMEQVRNSEPQTAALTHNNPAFVVMQSPERVAYLAEKLAVPVLDIGSGNKRELTDIVSATNVIYADKFTPPEGGVIADIYELEKVFKQAQFSSIYASNMMHFAEEFTLGITSMKRVLTPNGIIVLETGDLVDALAGLKAAGIDLDTQTEVNVFRSVRINSELGITIPIPNLLLTISNSASS